MSGGMAKGDLSKIKYPSFLTETQRQPDMVLHMDRKFTIPASDTDMFLWYQIPYHLPDTFEIAAIRIHTIDTGSLHHCELYANPRKDFPFSTNSYDTLSSIIQTGYVYRDSGNTLFPQKHFIAANFPGLVASKYPLGVTNTITPDQYLLLYAHYSPRPIAHSDSIWFDIFLAKTKGNRPFSDKGINAFYHLENGPFVIEPDSIKTFYCKMTIKRDLSAFAFVAHAHNLCTKMTAFAISPEGDTIPLIKIDKWEFHWQRIYELDSFLVLRKGTVVHCFGTFDNTPNNPSNPSSPPRTVHQSMSARDEMMLFSFQSVPYQPGDEHAKVIYPEGQ